jgi:superfamily II DNA or RNA helicase/SAM-dependent methyltransferase
MSAIYSRFLPYIPAGGLVLDAGCGSGRDSKAFLARGYAVRAFDASAEIAARASSLIGQPVEVLTFESFQKPPIFDGIWACASLLHLNEADIPSCIARLWAGLKSSGVFYLSFKYGDGERSHDGRHFTDATEARLRFWLTDLPEVSSIEVWTTDDARSDRQDIWLNAIIHRAPVASRSLITGESTNPFLTQLSGAMAQAAEIELAVAFIKATGLRLLMDDLHAALGHDGLRSLPPVRLRVLTSDYLDVTDPDALRLLLLLQEKGAQVRVFESGNASFHLKAYLFTRFGTHGDVFGTAFVGSSNISRMALTDGLEWNYRVDYPGDPGFLEARARFEELFRDPRTRPLTDAWIEAYERRRVTPVRAIAPGTDEHEPPPEPSRIQTEALDALLATRQQGFRRGLVVLATGLGKTWLAAFDAEQISARRVLFIAHREEILHQAAATFLRIRPNSRIGYYTGKKRDEAVDVLCASVQTIGQNRHLERFPPQHFDYIVVDEFHHAAAPTYRRVLAHFVPQFLLGLTATPDRSDQSDILSLCDDNLVFSRNLFDGVSAGLLAPFHYYGIWDETVDYQEIPWRNGKFDPEQLTNKLATLARARHALALWRAHRQARTLAFCVSIKHAEYMAEQFRRQGVRAAAVYAGSELGRVAALDQLAAGRLEVIFSVDLFNEGVDLPSIDTVLMLRPTESKILFLQQLGRGLRRAEGKERLVVLDFIGNHQSFLNKPQALAQAGSTFRELAAFAREVEAGRLSLPPGCFLNFDLRLIEFLKALDSEGPRAEYEALKAGLGRRPSLNEFYRSGASVQRMRRQYGHWFALVTEGDDLSQAEAEVVRLHRPLLTELETTSLTKSFKLVLLEAFQELDGWRTPPRLEALAQRSWQVLQRRRPLLGDLPDEFVAGEDGTSKQWQRYWLRNPVSAWAGGITSETQGRGFQVADDHFIPAFSVSTETADTLSALVQEITDYRLATYEARQAKPEASSEVISLSSTRKKRVDLPFFPNLPIACGHFRTGTTDAEEHRSLGSGYGHLDPARHFIARASGNSMNGGKTPVRDGDYLLLELVNSNSTVSITGNIMAVERQGEAGEHQYLLRVVTKESDGHYTLKANNPEYVDLYATEEMRIFARLHAVLDPLELVVGQPLMREEIPPLFGETFNPGSWNAGHVVLREQKAHVLLVTLNKQGKGEDHRYLDHWIDEAHFHWQSQNATTTTSLRGKEIINHQNMGIKLHLFVREHKLQAGKAAPFIYQGAARYLRHTGDAPMSVILELS